MTKTVELTDAEAQELESSLKTLDRKISWVLDNKNAKNRDALLSRLQTITSVRQKIGLMSQPTEHAEI